MCHSFQNNIALTIFTRTLLSNFVYKTSLFWIDLVCFKTQEIDQNKKNINNFHINSYLKQNCLVDMFSCLHKRKKKLKLKSDLCNNISK